ncbi:MAG: type II toxin-antitoxin system HicB family antitoxin [Planctomycetota bacterium]|nr:type II toxin-antitoxin system HicB family antitoxin [Planctomycetota bacterium]
MTHIKLTSLTEQDGDGYVLLCPELDIASQGDTPGEARRNLIEAVQSFLEIASRSEIQSRLAHHSVHPPPQ